MTNLRARAILATAALPLLVGAWFQTRPFDVGFYARVPFSERAEAWGATDPSWSPRGDEIAFSLYGGIWRMPAAGGVARQVTSAAGYDAGAAWSPSGGSIAFLRGTRPIAGTQLGVTGKLMLVNLATGAERTLAPERTFAGTPAWTPDGESLLVNEAAEREVILQEVSLSGAVRRHTGNVISRVPTIVQRGTAWLYYWYPAAVNAGLIAYGGDRDGTPQLWRVPLKDGVQVATKLTRFRERDQTDIQDVAWESDKSILFSANVTNDRTNFDLWRWTEAGTTRLTWTLQDEFSPRLSPDGRTVLFVSNYLGNPDLFTTTPALEPARHLRIDRLEFRQGTATLRLKLESPARVSVRCADRKFYSPRGALYRYNAGMGESAGFFHASGAVDLSVPAGGCFIDAWHGFEHAPASVAASLRPGETVEREIRLERKLHWQGNGWWSGEDHIHANYAGPYYLRPEDALLMSEAEDLNVANMLVANAEGERPYDREFFEGRPSRYSRPAHILYWNEEFRNRIVYGHMALLNLRALTNPIYTSFEGSPNPFDYPSNTMMASSARKAGAVVDYVHPLLGQTRDPFDFTVSAKELPVTAALGLVDVVDIYPWGGPSLELWYQLLNCGFRIAPGAGTDTFSNWRSINQLPGNSRIYVNAAGPLSYAAWIDGMRRGRSFVTNGPLISLRVNGTEPGGRISSQPGQPLHLNLQARVEAATALERAEVIFNGRVIATMPAQAGITWSGEVSESGWLALRVSGPSSLRALGAAAQAHTAPIYLLAGGTPMRPNAEAARLFVEWIDRLWNLVEQRNNFARPEHKAEVQKLILQARAFYSRWK